MSGLSISNRIPQAIEDTLKTYLRSYCDAPDVARCAYLREPEQVNASQFPAIGIFETGDEVLSETIRGRSGATLNAGVSELEYGYDLQYFVKGLKRADSLEIANRWRDGIRACLQDKFDLQAAPGLYMRCTGGEPNIIFEDASVVLRSGVIRATCLVYVLQGATRLTGES